MILNLSTFPFKTYLFETSPLKCRNEILFSLLYLCISFLYGVTNLKVTRFFGKCLTLFNIGDCWGRKGWEFWCLILGILDKFDPDGISCSVEYYTWFFWFCDPTVIWLTFKSYFKGTPTLFRLCLVYIFPWFWITSLTYPKQI